MVSIAMNPSRALFVGRSTLDALYCLDELPAEDSKVYSRDFRATPGGPALNAAITHSLLGGEAMLISAVGGGPWAALVRAELAHHQIALHDLAAGTAYETPLTTVLINNATSSRTIVNPPISTVQLTPLPTVWEQAVPTFWGALPPVLLCDGFHLAETLPLLAACKAAGSAICLDGGSWKPGTEELAPLLSVAICSERFAVPEQTGLTVEAAEKLEDSGEEHPSGAKAQHLFSRSCGTTEVVPFYKARTNSSFPADCIDASTDRLFNWFAEKCVPSIALTRGPRPILGYERGRRFEIEIAQIDAADTLGAGDVLHGAFAYFFASGMEFEPALRRAAEIATFSCQSMGIQAWATGALGMALNSALPSANCIKKS
jgi:sugar/nucleoside kinase (ribokinase family)